MFKKSLISSSIKKTLRFFYKKLIKKVTIFLKRHLTILIINLIFNKKLVIFFLIINLQIKYYKKLLLNIKKILQLKLLL